MSGLRNLCQRLQPAAAMSSRRPGASLPAVCRHPSTIQHQPAFNPSTQFTFSSILNVRYSHHMASRRGIVGLAVASRGGQFIGAQSLIGVTRLFTTCSHKRSSVVLNKSAYSKVTELLTWQQHGSSRLIAGQMRRHSSNLIPKLKTSLSQAQINALRFKTRKGGSKRRAVPGRDEWSVVGYSAADSFDMIGLQEGLSNQLIYTEVDLLDELSGQCICVTNKYNIDLENMYKEIYFFKDGNVIFWNVPELERNSVLKFLLSYSIQAYDEDIIYEESEMMNFKLLDNLNTPGLEKGVIRLNPNLESYPLDKYTFSNAIASSVKLGTWESALDNIINSIEHISEDLKRSANVTVTSSEVLKKSGEILALRHLINLSGDLLDTPDFYWDREGLENMYLATCSHLSISKRIKIVNEKLNHCLELLDLVSTHLSTQHGARLEWIIIILIGIEILFEVLHLVERKWGGFAILDPKT